MKRINIGTLIISAVLLASPLAASAMSIGYGNGMQSMGMAQPSQYNYGYVDPYQNYGYNNYNNQSYNCSHRNRWSYMPCTYDVNYYSGYQDYGYYQQYDMSSYYDDYNYYGNYGNYNYGIIDPLPPMYNYGNYNYQY